MPLVALLVTLLGSVGTGDVAPAQNRGGVTVTGGVWHDLDRDGVRDVGEPLLADVTVELLLVPGGVQDSTVTDGSGSYSLAAVEPGDYQVRVEPPDEFHFTLQDEGDDATDSDFDRNSGKTELFDGAATFDAGLAPLELGRLDLNLDFGRIALGESVTLPVVLENIESHPVTLPVLAVHSFSNNSLGAWDCAPAPVTLLPGETCTGEATYTANFEGSSSGSSVISTAWNPTDLQLGRRARFVDPVYVDPSVAPGGSGTSWEDAFASIDDALAAGGGGRVEIWVTSTVVHPTTTLSLPAGSAIIGSFSGGEVGTVERDLSNGPTTILSGDLALDDLDPDGDQVTADAGDIQGTNLSRLVESPGGLDLDGLVLTGGDGAGEGSAVHADVLDLRDSRVVGNRGVSAVYVDGVADVVRSVLSANDGVALRLEGVRGALVESSAFVGNGSAGDGAAILATDAGGTSGYHFELRSTLFAGNAAGGAGGALRFTPMATRGGVVPANLRIERCTFADNVAGTTGGAISASLTGNDDLVIDSVFWGNRDSGVDASSWFLHLIDPGSMPVEASAVEGSGGSSAWDTDFGTDLGGNLDVDPLFADAPGAASAPSAAGDYRLLASSPLIDLGALLHPEESFDAGGGPRLIGAAVDLGAYEGGVDLPIFADGFESGDTQAWQ